MTVSEKTPKQEAEALMNSLLPVAKRMLAEHGEFYPYGGYLDEDDEVVHVGAQIEGTDRPESRPLIETLKANFQKLVDEKKCKAVGIIYNVSVHLPGSGEKSDAIQVCIEHRNDYSAEVFLPYEIDGTEVVYGSIFAQRGEKLFFA